MKRTITLMLTACILLIGSTLPAQQTAPVPEWKAEFDDICAKTIDAMDLPQAEIRTLIGRCDRLKLRIEKLDETTSKVYLRRLQMCRELFAFVLDNPRTDNPAPPAAPATVGK